jgi:nucleoside-diphosphate-sugar epimerase
VKVLITGGTGFIGSRLALKCLEKNMEVSVLGQENTPAEIGNKREIENKGANVYLTSVSDKKGIEALLDGVDYVIHLAAAQHEMNVPDKRFRDVNVEGTRNLIDASLMAGVKKFIHGSTIGVYGIMDGEIDENTNCNPDNIYGVTKLEGEKLVLSYKNKLPVTILRIPETYGPGDRRLLKMFKGIKKGVFPLIGKGDNLHHLIYVDDLIEGFLVAAENDNANGKIFLLSGVEPVSTKQMINIMVEILEADKPKIRLPLPLMWSVAFMMEKTLRPLGIQPPLHRRRLDFYKKSFSLSAKKAKDSFGFDPKVTFKEGVKLTAEWYSQNNLL